MTNSTLKKRIIDALVFILGVFALILMYQLFAWYKQNTAFSKHTMKILVPNITKIFKSFISLFAKESTYKGLLFTAINLILSIFAGGMIGIILGLVAGMRRRLSIFLKPFMSTFRSAPVVILVIILILAINDNSYIPFVCTTLVIIPIYYQGALEGVKSIDKDMVDAYRMYSSFNIRVIRYVYLPAIKHFVKASFVTAVSFGLKVIISTEYLAGSRNTMGQLMSKARADLRYSDLYAYFIVVIIIILLIEFIPFIINFSMKKDEE